jgi:hypothetical protein
VLCTINHIYTMTFQFRTYLFLVLCICFLSSCNKESTKPGAPAVFDSSETAKVVTITEKEHRIFIRPKAGDILRYRITQKSLSSAVSTGAVTANESATAEDEYYVKQTIRTIRPDSTIDLTFRFDSISVKLEKDTMKINLSSNRPADRNDPRFASYAALLGEDIGIIMTRFGDIKEMYGTTNIVGKIMKHYPDSMQTMQNRETMKNQIEATVAQYVRETMMHYPDHPLGKDSTEKADFEQNMPVWVSVIYPMQVNIKQVLTGFEERGDKVLALFNTQTTITPKQLVIENGPVKTTLKDYSAITKEDLRVDDATGILVLRKVSDDQSFTVNLESKEEPGKGLTTARKSKTTRTIELLK